ncbi:MAG: hypothetical protein K1Y36_27515, partial [Blastocatellia bacterium]|nr:hypothetical protein [Blastocatellia bacterium]
MRSLLKIGVPSLMLAFLVSATLSPKVVQGQGPADTILNQGVTNIQIDNFQRLPIDTEFQQLTRRALREHGTTRSGLTVNPAAIPTGTPLNKVAFVGLDLDSSVNAFADTDGDGIPDNSAREKFASTDNPDSQITSGIAFSLKSGKFYVAGMDGDTQRGVLQI